MTTAGAALELYHDIGLEIGLTSKLSPAQKSERNAALIEHARRHGIDGIEALVLGGVFDAVERGDRKQAVEGAKLFDRGVARRRGDLLTGRLPVIDSHGKVSVYDGLGLADLGLGDIVGGVSDRGSLGSRIPNFRPGPTMPSSGQGEVSGGTPGVSVGVFGKGGLIEVEINGHGTDIVVGTAGRGAAIGGIIGGGVGAAVGGVVGAIIGVAAAIYDWFVGQEVEKMKQDLIAQLKQTAKELQELQERLNAQADADRKRREEQEKKDNNNNNDDDDDDDNDNNDDDEPDDPDDGGDPDGGGEEMPGWDDDGRTRGHLSARDLARIVALLGEFSPKGPSDGPGQDPGHDGGGAPASGIDLVDIRLDPALDFSPEANEHVPPKILISWRAAAGRHTSDGSDYNADGIPNSVPGAVEGAPDLGGGLDPAANDGLLLVKTPHGQRSGGRLRFDLGDGEVSIIMGE